MVLEGRGGPGDMASIGQILPRVDGAEPFGAFGGRDIDGLRFH